MCGVLRLLQHAPVELHPAQLAVQEMRLHVLRRHARELYFKMKEPRSKNQEPE
jgi:hypothetical protein